MLPILFGLLLWLPALAGLGDWGLRFLGVQNVLKDEGFLFQLFVLTFTGIAVAGSVALLMNFAMPINPAVASGIWLFGAFGLIHLRLRMPPYRVIFVLLVLAIAVSWLNARSFRHGDTGLYHWQAVKWAANSIIVPGLANLNPWFGHNSTLWLFTAGLGLPGLSGHTAHLVSASLLFCSLALLVNSISRIWERNGMSGDWIIVIASYLILRQGLGINTPGIATSMAANLFIFASSYLAATSYSRSQPAMLDLSLILAIFSVTIKLQALPLMLVIGAVWAARILNLGRYDTRSGIVAGAGILLMFLWMARGVLVSGYPVFPAAVFGFRSLPWALSDNDVNSFREAIGAWPLRGVESGASLAQKVMQWILNQGGFQNLTFLAIALAGLLVTTFTLLFLALRKVSAGKEDSFCISVSSEKLVVLAIGLAGLGYCAALAPAFQYASGYFFLVLGVGVSLLLHVAEWKTWKKSFLACALLMILGGAFLLNGGLQAFPVVKILRWPEFPAVKVEKFTAGGGGVVHYSPDGFAWDAPIPASIAIEPRLIDLPSDRGETPRAFLASKRRPSGE